MMVPEDNFTPHGYLDNPFHSWKINPSGVLRSKPPLGMGWHMPNLGSYVRNQFQYTAHLMIGLKLGSTVLITPEDFKQHGCTISSPLHTKNRFTYTCFVPAQQLTLTASYFLIEEHILGCIISCSTSTDQPLDVTLYLIHCHTHNPYTSRLWEHGLYAIAGPEPGSALLGLASEGDVFTHGARAADGGPLEFHPIGYTLTLEDAARQASWTTVPQPTITEHEENTGWQTRTVIIPCTFSLQPGQERIINAVLARGVSQDESAQRWLDGIEQIARANADRRADDEDFWEHAPQLAGDWPATWRRGLVYDLETLRMVTRPSVGLLKHFFDGMQIQAPRLVLAEAAMDALFLSYADPELAAEVILEHFTSAPRPNLPCMREDGSYNMVADDGQICGTAPEWGFPAWCCDLIWRKTGDLQWLRQLYPYLAAYFRWWLDQRRDAEGWLVYACSWESGQDVSSRFGPQQTGGSIIEHIRPVDLQASMAQGASILARWATVLAQAPSTTISEGGEINFATEKAWWQDIADEFTAKTRSMWQDGWFRDYDAGAQEWSTQQDTMHLAAIFCGVADQEQSEQLQQYFTQPPIHSGWQPLSWPPVVMTLIGAADVARLQQEASELAYRFIDATYRSTDSREIDQHGGLPGVTREYRQTISVGKRDEIDYINAGIEGYGWGALSVHLLIHHLLGLRSDEPDTITLRLCLPQALRRSGATYSIAPLPWGKYTLSLTCQVKSADSYEATLQVLPRTPDSWAAGTSETQPATVSERTYQWEAAWGEEQTFQPGL